MESERSDRPVPSPVELNRPTILRRAAGAGGGSGAASGRSASARQVARLALTLQACRRGSQPPQARQCSTAAWLGRGSGSSGAGCWHGRVQAEGSGRQAGKRAALASRSQSGRGRGGSRRGWAAWRCPATRAPHTGGRPPTAPSGLRRWGGWVSEGRMHKPGAAVPLPLAPAASWIRGTADSGAPRGLGCRPPPGMLASMWGLT